MAVPGLCTMHCSLAASAMQKQLYMRTCTKQANARAIGPHVIAQLKAVYDLKKSQLECKPTASCMIFHKAERRCPFFVTTLKLHHSFMQHRALWNPMGRDKVLVLRITMTVALV